MSIEHRNIPESGLHEPKGVSAAPAKRVYVSDGVGSGSWVTVDADALKGAITGTTPAGERVVTDGAGGFSSEEVLEPSYAMMNLTNSSATTAVTAASDSTLATDTDYVEVTTTMGFNNLKNFNTGPNYLEVINPGVYEVDFWANAKSDTNNTILALKFVVNDVAFVARRPKNALNTAGTLRNFSANGLTTLAAGDRIKLYIASTTTANITFEDLTFQLNYVDIA